MQLAVHAFILTTINPDLIARKLIELAGLNLSPDKFFKQADIIVLKPEKSITINQVRQLKNRLSKKPLNLPKQIGILLEANKMTLPAQQALLKLLEEPNQYTILCLAADNPYRLLPTVLSRSQIISLAPEAKDQLRADQPSKLESINQLLKAGAGERLKLIEPYSSNREMAQEFALDTINIVRGELRNPKSRFNPQTISQILTKTLQLNRDLEANLNVKLSLDHWALSL